TPGRQPLPTAWRRSALHPAGSITAFDSSTARPPPRCPPFPSTTLCRTQLIFTIHRNIWCLVLIVRIVRTRLVRPPNFDTVADGRRCISRYQRSDLDDDLITHTDLACRRNRSTIVRTGYSTIARGDCIARDRQTGTWCFLQFNGLTYSYRRRTIVANGYCKGRALTRFHTCLISHFGNTQLILAIHRNIRCLVLIVRIVRGRRVWSPRS